MFCGQIDGYVWILGGEVIYQERSHFFFYRFGHAKNIHGQIRQGSGI